MPQFQICFQLIKSLIKVETVTRLWTERFIDIQANRDIFQSHTQLLEFVPILQGHHTNVAALEKKKDIKDGVGNHLKQTAHQG